MKCSGSLKPEIVFPTSLWTPWELQVLFMMKLTLFSFTEAGLAMELLQHPTSSLWSAVLAVRRVGGRGDRRPSAGQRRRADVCPLSGGEGVLERSVGEGLRQVRPPGDSA